MTALPLMFCLTKHFTTWFLTVLWFTMRKPAIWCLQLQHLLIIIWSILHKVFIKPTEIETFPFWIFYGVVCWVQMPCIGPQCQKEGNIRWGLVLYAFPLDCASSDICQNVLHFWGSLVCFKTNYGTVAQLTVGLVIENLNLHVSS